MTLSALANLGQWTGELSDTVSAWANLGQWTGELSDTVSAHSAGVLPGCTHFTSQHTGLKISQLLEQG